MGETKTIKAKVIHKHETEAGWLKSSYVPGKGEIVFYDAEVDESGVTLPTAVEYYNSNGTEVFPLGRKEAITYARQKIGDGVNLVRDLPFCTITELAEIELISAVEGPLFDIGFVGKGRISLKFLSSCYFMYGGRRYAIAKDVTVAALNRSTTSQRLVCTIPEYTTKTVTNAENEEITVSAITTSITASNLRFVDATNCTLKSNDIVLLSIANTSTVQQLLIPANLSTKAPYSVDGVTAGKSLKTVYVSSEGTSSGLGTKDSPITLEMALASDAEVILLKPESNYSLGDYRVADKTNLTIRTDWPEEYDSGLKRARATITGINSNDEEQTGFIIKFEHIQNLVLEDLIFEESKHYNCFIQRCDNFLIRNCEFGYAGEASCLAIYNSNGTIVGCEAHDAGCSVTSGHCDGINLHECGHTVIIDTVAYDNLDDGISHHEGCVGTIIGGEYYNNGKGGISSPVSGAQVNIYNAYTHDNKYGIYTAGTSGQEDVTGDCRVHSCIIENNKYAFRAQNYDIYSYNNALIGNEEKICTTGTNGEPLEGLGHLFENWDTGLSRGAGKNSLILWDSEAISDGSLSLGAGTFAGSKAFEFKQGENQYREEKIDDVAHRYYTITVGVYDEDGNEISDEATNLEIVDALTRLNNLIDEMEPEDVAENRSNLARFASINIAVSDKREAQLTDFNCLFQNSILINEVKPEERTIVCKLRTLGNDSIEGEMLTNLFKNGRISTNGQVGYITLVHYPEQGIFDLGYGAVASGVSTCALGYASHAEGSGSQALGNEAHAEGYRTYAYTYGHAEGTSTKAYGRTSHVEGKGSIAYGFAGHAEGQGTRSYGSFSHAEGSRAVAGDSEQVTDFLYNHSLSNPVAAHAEGINTEAKGRGSHAEGRDSVARGDVCHAEGYGSVAHGDVCHAEGYNTYANGAYTHSEGAYTSAGTGFNAYTINDVLSAGKLEVETKKGLAVGYKIAIVGAEEYEFEIKEVGSTNTININPPLPSWLETGIINADYRHFIIIGKIGEGDYPLSANYSHAEGKGTMACGETQHVSGKYNVPDCHSLVIVGNGQNDTNRSNAYRLDRDGNAEFSGGVSSKWVSSESLTTKTIKQEGCNATEGTTAIGLNTQAGTLVYEVVDTGAGPLGLSITLKSVDGLTREQTVDIYYEGAFGDMSVDSVVITDIDETQNIIYTDFTGMAGSVYYVKTAKGLTGDTIWGEYSFACGEGVRTELRASSARGRYNKTHGEFANPDYGTSEMVRYLDCVGNGTSDSNRSNAYALDEQGNAWFAGEVHVNNDKRLAKASEIPTKVSQLANDAKYLKTTDTTAINGILSKGAGQDSIQQKGSTANDKNSIALGLGTHTGKTLTIQTVTDEDTFTIGNANYYLESGDCIYFPALDEYGIVKTVGAKTVHLEGEISDLAPGQIIEVLSPKNEKGQTFSSGLGTIAVGRAQSVRGSYNKSSGKYLDIVGNGCVDDNGKTVRSNAYTLDWDGNAEFAGTVKAKGVDLVDTLGTNTSAIKDLEYWTMYDFKKYIFSNQLLALQSQLTPVATPMIEGVGYMYDIDNIPSERIGHCGVALYRSGCSITNISVDDSINDLVKYKFDVYNYSLNKLLLCIEYEIEGRDISSGYIEAYREQKVYSIEPGKNFTVEENLAGRDFRIEATRGQIVQKCISYVVQ